MKNVICFIGLMFMSGVGFAATEVNEIAHTAGVGSVSVSSHVAVDMSSGTLVSSPVAYNICNESTTTVIRCGYTSSVSTITANGDLGFPVRPASCEYRAVGALTTKVYCKAEGTSAISVVRELFGR